MKIILQLSVVRQMDRCVHACACVCVCVFLCVCLFMCVCMCIYALLRVMINVTLRRDDDRVKTISNKVSKSIGVIRRVLM